MLPIHFPKTLAIVLAVLFFFNAPAYAVNVGKVVVGKEYNDILRTWIDRRLGILITDHYGIMIAADTGLGQANFYLGSLNSTKKKLESSVLKAIKWSEIAKKNKADVRKRIGCFEKAGGFSTGCSWHEYLHPDKYNYLAFEFSSLEKGKETNLIVTIRDRSKKYKEATIYLGPPEMKQLLRNIKKIDEAMEESYAMEKKEALFN